MNAIFNILRSLDIQGSQRVQEEAFLSDATDFNDLELRIERLSRDQQQAALNVSLMGYQSH